MKSTICLKQIWTHWDVDFNLQISLKGGVDTQGVYWEGGRANESFAFVFRKWPVYWSSVLGFARCEVYKSESLPVWSRLYEDRLLYSISFGTRQKTAELTVGPTRYLSLEMEEPWSNLHDLEYDHLF